MKQSFIVLFIIILLSSCKEDKIKVGKLQSSIGERNELALVIEDSLWNGAVGDSIRKWLVRPVDDILLNEPLFDIVQYNPKIFTANAKLTRNIIDFSITDLNEFTLKKSLYATPQNYFSIKAKTKKSLLETIEKQADSIMLVIQKSELNEEQHLINRLAKNDNALMKDLFGVSLKIPTYYHLIDQSEYPFLWYQKALASGDINLIMFEFPFEVIEKNTEIEKNIIKAMDSVGKVFVKGRKSFTYMVNDSIQKPTITTTKIDDMDYYKVRGLWGMINDYNYGPYVCYVIKDNFYKRYLFVQGFINDPERFKRDHLLELEAILKSINFYENEL